LNITSFKRDTYITILLKIHATNLKILY